MPSIGKMKQRISLFDRSAVEADDYSVMHNDAFIASVWAQVINIVGTEQVDGREVSEAATHQFNIRFRADVSKQTVLVYEGLAYEIETISVMDDERNRFMTINAKQSGVSDVPEVPIDPVFPSSILVYGAGTAEVNGEYVYDEGTAAYIKGAIKISGMWMFEENWAFMSLDESLTFYLITAPWNEPPPKIEWLVAPDGEPEPPTLDY